MYSLYISNQMLLPSFTHDYSSVSNEDNHTAFRKQYNGTTNRREITLCRLMDHFLNVQRTRPYIKSHQMLLPSFTNDYSNVSDEDNHTAFTKQYNGTKETYPVTE